MKPFRKKPIFRRKLTDMVVRGFSLLTLCFALFCMGWILWATFSHGIRSINWEFLTHPSKPWGVPLNGIANAILGSLLITAGAAVISVPPAILGGIYLSEFGRSTRLGNCLRFGANVMMGIPSIITGLFTYAVIVVPTGNFSGLAGSAALAVIMFPIVLRTTEDILAMIPDSLRESALALGMSRARATLKIICRTGRTGLVTGVLLAVARAAGETAPLLFTAMWSDAWPTRYFTQPTANLPVLINEYATNSPYEGVHAMGWGAALLVTFAILGMNIFCRLIFKDPKHD